MNQVTFQIPTVSDETFVRAVEECCAPSKPHKLSFKLRSSPEHASDSSWSEIANPNSTIGRMVAMRGTNLAYATAFLDNGGLVVLNRQEQKHSVGVRGFADELFGLECINRLERRLHAASPDINLPAQLREDFEKYYRHRESTLIRLEESLARLQESATSDVAERERLFREREEALDAKYAERLAELDRMRADEKAALDDAHAKLAARIKDIDDRENTFVRREIRKELKAEIKRRQTQFGVTKDTQQKRVPIIAAVLALATVLGAGFLFYGYELIKAPPQGNALIVAMVRQLLLGIGFGGAVWFFIHWQNQWFQRHADEEFKLKRLEIDFERASWVVELAMECSKEGGRNIPDSVLSELTRNLFSDSATNLTATKPDVFSALLDASTKAELAVGDARFSLNRGGSRKLREAMNSTS